MKMIFTNTEMNKTVKRITTQIFFNLSQRLDLIISNKYVALQNLFIYYIWENIRQNNSSNMEL